jgi:hypothetical protein
MLETSSVEASTGPSVPAGLALARFSEARGYPVFEAGGALWARGVTTKHLFDRLPLHATAPPDLGALRRALLVRPAFGAQYATSAGGNPSGLYVCRPREWSIQRMTKKRRQHLRRAAERTEVRWVVPEELLAAGLAANRDTMERQRRFDPELGTPEGWRRFVIALAECPGLRCAGAFVDGHLAAYGVACRDGRWLHLRYRMSRTEDLQHNASVALDAWLILEAARDPAIDVVCQGFVVPGAEGLDRYKRELGYDVVPVGRALELHPLLRPVLASGLARRAARLASRARPGDRRLDTLSTLLGGVSGQAEAR